MDHAREHRVALIALIAGACVIGAGPAFVRLSAVGPVATAFWRLALGLPLLAAWRWWSLRGGEPKVDDGRAGGVLVLAGIALATDLAVWHWSIRLTSVANATVMANLAPVFVVIAGALFFRQRPRSLFLLGLCLAVIGAGMLAHDSAGLGSGHLWGDALGACSACSYAGYLMAVDRLRRVRGTAEIMFGTAVACAAALLPAALLMEGSILPPTAAGWLPLIALAWFAHALGQGLITFGLGRLPITFGSVALLVQPVVAAVIAWLAFDEAIGAWQAGGAAAILLGIAVARRGS